MKISLKNIKTHQGRQGYGLNADIFVDGNKVIHVLDEGNGGCFKYTPYGEIAEDMLKNRAILHKLDDYAKTLTTSPFEQLDELVNQLFDQAEQDKFIKKNQNKITKLQKTAIVYGEPINAKGFRFGYLDYKRDLSTLPTAELQNIIDKRVKPNLKENEQILNTNLKELGIIV